jgi:hypothetical protein
MCVACRPGGSHISPPVMDKGARNNVVVPVLVEYRHGSVVADMGLKNPQPDFLHQCNACVEFPRLLVVGAS